MVISAAVFLQKVRVPGLPLPATTALLPALAMIGLSTGSLQVDRPTLLAYLVFVACACLSACLSASPDVSLSSLCLLVIVLVPFVFRCTDRTAAFQGRVMRFTADLALFISAIGIVQFLAQDLVGRSIAFFVDLNLPDYIYFSGFNSLNPLYYASSTLKSNGVFLAEPSYFSQFVALGIAIECSFHRRLWRLLVFAGAMICSYSGTGIIILAVWAPFFVFRRNNFTIFAIGLTVIALITVLFGDRLGLDMILSRSAEIDAEGSSGFARFVSMFLVIDQIILTDLHATLIGRGPGTVTEFYWKLSFLAFDSTWGKLFYEFGLCGAVSFLIFYAAAIRGGGVLAIPATAMYFVTGGYLADATVISLVVALVIWLPRPTEQREAGQAQTAPVTASLTSVGVT